MAKTVFKVITTLLIGVMALTSAGCNNSTKPTSESEVPEIAQESEVVQESEIAQDSEASAEADSSKNPIVTIEMDDGKKIEVELYPEYAPNTVNNFVSLVNQGFYDGTVFHRIIEGFMIQGGDPTGTGAGGPGYGIDGEMPNNGFAQNTLKHTRGVISMARAQSYNSAGSQFFIMHEDSPFLDDEYAPFGKVISGIEVVDDIVSGPKTGPRGDLAAEPRVMKTVTVDTAGIEYPEPVKNNNR